MAVYKRGKIWYVDILLPDGKRHRERVGTSKEVAEKVQKDMEVQKAKGEFGFLPKDSNLLPLFDQFIEKTKNDNAPGTVVRYKGIIENFKRFLAKTYPHITKHSHLRPHVFENYKTYRAGQEAKPKTINIELQTLKSIMIMAIEWGYAKNNPAEKIDLITIKASIEGGRWLSSEEVKKLLSHSKEWLYPIFYTFIYSG
ncbi:MAG: phage integrase SAM-like domain-containing protein, partial [Candidatus Omnitrophica bacterium]|nr:phage integrase SAM-like domain-containing protein [Candidatus Omnitrophota bacterium]